jgi:HKD family nuclease
MAYEMTVHAQDATSGRVGVVLDALEGTSQQAGSFEYVDVAVAYASKGGVRLLEDRLGSETWALARKRFLVSIDFGFTDPKALLRLSKLANAEVRVPNGRAVLRSPSLRPPTPFHAKAFAFRGDQWFKLTGLVVGSANLTASALSTGAEVVTKQVWTDNSFSSEAWEHLRQTKALLDWFDDVWEAADSLSDVMDGYRSARRRLPKPQMIGEDKTKATRHFLASPDHHVITGTLAVQLATAKALWVDASSVIRNRGHQNPGTQLNTPRGTRVFFGFDSKKVDKNTTLGAVNMRVADRQYVERTIRFSDNSMDIVNLPIPEENGLDSYQGSILVFERDRPSADGHEQFTLTTMDIAALASLREAAVNSIELSMHSGRAYGLLF